MAYPLYTKKFTRDYSLVIIETWGKGESISPRQWTKNAQPYLPYLIFEKTPETVICYMDERGIEWIKKEIFRLYKSNPKFIGWVLDNFLSRVNKAKHIWEKGQALNYQKLTNFIDALHDVWPWFEGVWWAIDMGSKIIGQDNVARATKTRVLSEKIGNRDAIIRNSLIKIFPALKPYVHVLTLNEIKTKKFPPPAVLKKRARGYYYINGKLITNLTRKRIEKKFGVTLENVKAPKKLKQVKGEIAYPGESTGRVKKIASLAQINKVKKGDVLVASMTLPDYLPALKKVSALVTDEGGIACHAAIVARELKIPCIIGTKIATQVFKDGDQVEVDAVKGIVRKL